MNSDKKQEIPGMDTSKDYSDKSQVANPPQSSQKDMEKTKKELSKLKTFITKKYPFTLAMGVLPPKSIKNFIEEEVGENVPQNEKDKLQNKNHLYMIIPDEKSKEIPKIKQAIVEQIEKTNENVWIYVKTTADVWETGLDSKFELMSAIAMSYPLYDKGILEALRVAEIHKSLVLQRFEKYVVSYVIGGSLVRGDAVKTSDVDAFIIINDTDVKRMPRLELKERLRGIIHQYISEAYALAGVKKNILNIQVYLLTDFWESVKDAHPVIFTFIRDGIPMYDRGTFMPWKVLLKMGKLKPSPEAIDMFMSMGDKTMKRAKNSLLDILIHDIYWGVLTPAQALLMLYGLPPPTTKEAPQKFREIFVEKEKMLESKYATILEKVVGKYKDYEHEKIKEIKGTEIDKFLKDTEDYLERLKELRKQIEKRAEGRTIEETYNNIFELLKSLTGKKSQSAVISDFEEMIKEGKFPPQHSKILKDVISARNEHKKGKTSIQKIENVRKNAVNLINDLIEYSQRKDLGLLDKSRIVLKYNNGKETAELIVGDNKSFLFKGNQIKKIANNKITASNKEEVNEFLESQKKKEGIGVKPEIFELLKKELGEFEISF